LHIKRHVTEAEKHVFHSLRNNFGRGLKAAGYGAGYAVELLGHTREHPVTEGYTGPYPMPQMHQVVATVDHKVDPREYIK
jgi:hypothetical protein